MSKNEKKKNAIRFGAIAVAILIFGGAFSVWALSTQATASAGIGDVEVDGITVDPANNDDVLLENSIAGRPGSLDASDDEPFELYDISEDDGEDGTGALDNYEYVATVYLLNGAELVDAGMRHLTLEMELVDDANGDEPVDTGAVTLEGGRATFVFDAEDIDATIQITGGAFGTYPFADFEDVENVEFIIDVEPGQEI